MLHTVLFAPPSKSQPFLRLGQIGDISYDWERLRTRLWKDMETSSKNSGMTGMERIRQRTGKGAAGFLASNLFANHIPRPASAKSSRVIVPPML